MNDMKNEQKVYIFDTTLRDGEQCPGASMNLREKLQVARQLARLKVDVIEAGFPIASPGDFEAVKSVAQQIKGPIIAGLARCINKDIECCAEALAPAGSRGRIHTFLATSAIHRQFKLRKAKTEILRQAVAGVQYARSFMKDVQFSPEDASRTEPDFLAEIVKEVIDAGASTVNIPDTVGYAIPQEFGRLIAYLFDHVPNIGQARIHVHCHNDLGLAVANSLEAVRCGARGIECTVNGLGERAGNCSLEEVVMALRTRADQFAGLWSGVEARELVRASRLVSQLTGMTVQRNKAIVGANAFAHESGIHQDGMLKHRSTYEIMNPEDVGVTGTDLVLGKHSGRHGLASHLARIGFQVSAEELPKVYERFVALADKKKFIYDDDLVAILHETTNDAPAVYELDYFHVSTGTRTIPTATVRIKKGKQVFTDSACGDGPVDAALKTIDRITGIQSRLTDFAIRALTQGEDALGEVSIRVAFDDGHMISAKGASTDIVESTVKAYLNAVNTYLCTQGRKPSAKTRGKK